MTSRIEKLTQDVGHQLNQIGLTLATAESCTGGGLSFWLTSVAGSSKWIDRGFITYSNAAKIEMLSIRPSLLEKYGAVSKEIAEAMAKGALMHSNADISIAITGIAGPTGGSLEKPVGTVWIALAKKNANAHGYLNFFTGDRHKIRIQSILRSLEMLLTMIAREA